MPYSSATRARAQFLMNTSHQGWIRPANEHAIGWPLMTKARFQCEARPSTSSFAKKAMRQRCGSGGISHHRAAAVPADATGEHSRNNRQLSVASPCCFAAATHTPPCTLCLCVAGGVAVRCCCSPGAGFGAERLVLLDALLGLTCLLCSGNTSHKLQLCFWLGARQVGRPCDCWTA